MTSSVAGASWSGPLSPYEVMLIRTARGLIAASRAPSTPSRSALAGRSPETTMSAPATR